MKLQKKRALTFSDINRKKDYSIFIIIVIAFADSLSILALQTKQQLHHNASTTSQSVYFGVHVPGKMNTLSNVTAL